MIQRWAKGVSFFPAHTLTFFFADLRDYTRFVETRGDAAARELIADYRRLVRGHVAGTGGGEVKTEGDSFFVVFSTARQALHCAIGVLREAERLNAERPERPMRIGVGLHAGEPLTEGAEYVGSAVNIAARLAQSAGPGQLLVSEVVRGLLRTANAPPMEEVEGVALKGVEDPPRIYGVRWQGTDLVSAVTTAEVPWPRGRQLRIGRVHVPLPSAIGTAGALIALGAVFVLARPAEPSATPPTTSGAAAETLRVPAGTLPARAAALAWEAKLDDAGSSIARRYVSEVDAAAVRPRNGELELSVLKADGNAGVDLQGDIPVRFVADLQVRIQPGSDLRLIWSVRRTDQAEIQVRVETKSREIWISYVTVGGRSDRISGRPTVPEISDGHAARVALIADGAEYALYVDDRKVAQATERRLADVATPFGLQVLGKQGSVIVTAVRAFALGPPP